MYSEESMKSARFLMWSLGAVGLVIIALWVGNWITIASGHISPLSLIGMLLIVAITPLVSLVSYAWFKVRSGERLAAVALRHPKSYYVQIVVAKSFVAKARTVATVLDLPAPTLKRNSYATLVATNDALLIYGGGGVNPSLRMSIPTSTLAYARAGSYTNGVRTVPALDLGFVSTDVPASDAPVSLLFVPLIQPGLIPKPMPAQQLPAELHAMQRVTHPETLLPPAPQQ